MQWGLAKAPVLVHDALQGDQGKPRHREPGVQGCLWGPRLEEQRSGENTGGLTVSLLHQAPSPHPGLPRVRLCIHSPNCERSPLQSPTPLHTPRNRGDGVSITHTLESEVNRHASFKGVALSPDSAKNPVPDFL